MLPHMHGLVFNADKTQLVCFRTSFHPLSDDVIHFNNVQLSFSDHVVHLGHLLSFDLNDRIDTIKVHLRCKMNG